MYMSVRSGLIMKVVQQFKDARPAGNQTNRTRKKGTETCATRAPRPHHNTSIITYLSFHKQPAAHEVERQEGLVVAQILRGVD